MCFRHRGRLRSLSVVDTGPVTQVSAVITPEMRAAFGADGVVKVPGAVGEEWIDRILEDAQRQLVNGGPWVTDTNPGAATDRLFTTRYRWQYEPAVREFVFSSPIAAMAAALTGSSTMRFYFDHLLVKEPRTAAPTPWHQDIGYWPFLGKQIVSAWVSASAWIIHGAPPNRGSGRRVALSTRWLGDDATWFPHPGCDPTVTQDDTTAVAGEYPGDDERFPLAYRIGD